MRKVHGLLCRLRQVLFDIKFPSFLPQDTFLNSSRIAPTATTALVLGSSKTNAPDLSKSSNLANNSFTSPFRRLESLFAPPSSSYKPDAASQHTIPASLTSGLPMEQLHGVPDERWACVQDGHGNKTVGIWMISSCPKQWPADSTKKKKCEQSYSLSAENCNDMIPASDKRGVNYKNRHCAKCAEANASEIMSFELDINGMVTPPQHYSRAEALRFLFKYCSRIRWKAPDGNNRRHCKAISSSCETTSSYFQNCKNGSFRIVYDRATGKNYKNIFCAKCLKSKVSEFICGPGSRFIDGRSPVHKYNVLLHVLDKKKSLVAVSCPQGEVYDVHLEICRGAGMGAPNIANFDKYRVILWVTSPHSILLRRQDLATSLATRFSLDAS